MSDVFLEIPIKIFIDLFSILYPFDGLFPVKLRCLLKFNRDKNNWVVLLIV